MKFIKFECSTPYVGTDRSEYLVFEDDVTDSDLDMQSKGFAIENGKFFSHLIKTEIEGMNEYERNLYYLEYLQDCLDSAKWSEVTEQEFDSAIDDQLV